MKMLDRNTEPSVSRVNQLDALALDKEILRLFKRCFSGALQHMSTKAVVSFDPEISALVKFLLWKNTVSKSGATIGQNMLDLEYVDEKTRITIGNSKRNHLALVEIFFSWLSSRLFSSKALAFLTLEQQNHFLRSVNYIGVASQFVTFLNFLVFLRDGKYQFLYERILGIRSGNSNPQKLRQVQYEYMNRELLWHGFAEFVTFAVPLLNLYRVKNSITRLLWSHSTHEAIPPRKASDLRKCSICDETPTRPSEMGCVHVFCYYCISSNVKADPKYNCPKCFKEADGNESIRAISL